MIGKRLSTLGVIAVLASSLAVFAWAKDARQGDSQDFNRRERMREERLASLSAAERTLVQSVGPLRDSLHRAVGDYAHKVHQGSPARSLVAERARITSLKSEIARLEAIDPEVTLDLLARLPPGMERMRGCQMGKPWCPKMGDGLDSTHRQRPRHAPPPPMED